MSKVSQTLDRTLQILYSVSTTKHQTIMSDFASRQQEYGLASYEETKTVLQKPETVVLDIRRPDEIKETGRIEHPNFHQVTVTLDDASALNTSTTCTIAPDKNAPVFVYCRSGRRATNAVKTLKEQGYTNVINGGGFSDVQAALAGESASPAQ